MILLTIYIIISILSIITGIVSGITKKCSKLSYPHNKTPWYYEIYAGLVVPLFPLIILFVFFMYYIEA